MFKRVKKNEEKTIELWFNNEVIRTADGDSVAAALLASRVIATRTTERNTRRGPFCLMGTCYECVVEIDGKSNQRGCMTRARNGMRIRSICGLPKLKGISGD